MSHGDLHLVVDAGGVNVGPVGGHGHNDALSFDLWANGRHFIIDPGTYVYTVAPKWRNQFRSTAFHNTVSVDGEEIARLGNVENIFSFIDSVKTVVECWNTTDSFDLLRAYHTGFKLLPQPVVHYRTIIFNKEHGFWWIQDVICGEGEHRIESHLHFGPGPIRIELDDQAVYTDWQEGTNLAVITLKSGSTPNQWQLTQLKGWVSARYGQKIESTIARFATVGGLPLCHTFLLLPYRHKCDLPQQRKEAIQSISSLMSNESRLIHKTTAPNSLHKQSGELGIC